VVTPKLLPGLHYSDRVTVFNVFNGPRMPSQHEWDVDRFMRIALSGKLAEETKRKKQRMHARQQQQANTQMPASQAEESY